MRDLRGNVTSLAEVKTSARTKGYLFVHISGWHRAPPGESARLCECSHDVVCYLLSADYSISSLLSALGEATVPECGAGSVPLLLAHS
ncbi:hypothetical protein BgiBS90_013933 [Biomphalaria glabrata]|nr:hypothetical protein BgiBS90_013933 [Biomphalaria glabrata]